MKYFIQSNLFLNALKFFLLLAILCLFVPFSPKMPAQGLDPAWALGLNEAVARGMAFGKEIVFTLGPYSSIYTKVYHPATDWMMIAGSFYLALSYWFCLVILLDKVQMRWILLLFILFFGLVYSRDSLFFSYPLLVGLACYKRSEMPNPSFLWLVLFTPFGLLPLIKGSLLLLCTVIIGLCFLFFLFTNRKRESLLCFIIPVGSMMLFWLLAGQSLLYLPDFISSSFAIAAGFTEAMANDGNAAEVICYLINSLFILLFLAYCHSRGGEKRLFLVSIFFSFLMISFKSAFTRHFGHAFIAGTSLLIATFLLPLLYKTRLQIPLILLSLSSAIYINSHYMKVSLPSYVATTYSVAWHGFINRIKDSNWLKEDYALSFQFLQQQRSLPELQGTTDIYSYGQTCLISNNYNWAPRPVFQSYSVFTAKLATMNRRHLLGEEGPENILFRIEPIDGRLPSLEDGASWPLLISHYQPNPLLHPSFREQTMTGSSLVNDLLILQKKTIAPSSKNPLKPLGQKKLAFGQTEILPDKVEPIFVKIEIEPTLWGQLVILFYKPSPLSVNIELKNGVRKHFRLSANMAKSGFLLSPLIENTEEFALLYGKNETLASKQVKSFHIEALDKGWEWRHIYKISQFHLL